jgi:FkbM family methyltransferase
MRFQVGSVTVDLIDEGDRICLGVVAKAKPFEPRTLEVFGELCARPNVDCVLDVGAYTGLFSIAAAKMGCRVYSFEPLPQNFDRLHENARLNGVHVDSAYPDPGEIVVCPAAIAAANGTAELRYNPRVPFTSGASLVRAKPAHSVALKVATCALDRFDFADVAVIKIDVERAEPDVLRGARDLLARCKPALIVEVLGDDERASVLAAAPGYRVAEQMDGRNLLLLPA